MIVCRSICVRPFKYTINEDGGVLSLSVDVRGIKERKKRRFSFKVLIP